MKERQNSPASISKLGNRIMGSGPTMALAIMETWAHVPTYKNESRIEAMIEAFARFPETPI